MIENYSVGSKSILNSFSFVIISRSVFVNLSSINSENLLCWVAPQNHKRYRKQTFLNSDVFSSFTINHLFGLRTLIYY